LFVEGVSGHFAIHHSELKKSFELYDLLMNYCFEIFRYIQVLFIDACLMNVSHDKIVIKDFLVNFNTYWIDFENTTIIKSKYKILNEIKEKLSTLMLNSVLFAEKEEIPEHVPTDKTIQSINNSFDDTHLLIGLYIANLIEQNDFDMVQQLLEEYKSIKNNILSTAISFIMGAYRMTKSQIDMMNIIMKFLLKDSLCDVMVYCSYTTSSSIWNKSIQFNESLIKNLSNEANYISISMDLSTPNQTSIIAFVIRFNIGRKFITKMLLMKPYTDQEKAKNLFQYIILTLKMYNIEIKKLVSLTTDGARNNAGKYSGAAIQLQQYMYQQFKTELIFNYCLNHRHNLCLQTIIGNDINKKPHKYYLEIVNFFQSEVNVKHFNSFCYEHKSIIALLLILQDGNIHILFWIIF